jgi:hypothetical protein
MAFANVGPDTSIGPGQTIRWAYTYGGRDMGFQHAGANVLAADCELVAFDQGQVANFLGGITYGVSIRNTHPQRACLHNLQGGGAA